MRKDFDSWNVIKKEVDKSQIDTFIRSGDIWICNIGLNIGFETNGKNKNFARPVLVIKSYKKSGATVLPLTTKLKDDSFHFKLRDDSFVKLTQIRFTDRKRLHRKVGHIKSETLLEVRRKMFQVI